MSAAALTWCGCWRNGRGFGHRARITSPSFIATVTPTSTELIQQAWDRHKRGDLAYARSVYEQVVRSEPENALALHYLGLIAQQTGHPRVAISLLQKAIAIDPSDPRAYNHLGQIHLACGESATGIECFRQALQVQSTHLDSLNNLANALADGGGTDEALALYGRALELDPRQPHVLYNRARALNDKGAVTEAMEHYRGCIALRPDYYRAHHNLALCCEELGRFDAAIRHYREVLRIRPDHGRALANLIALPSFRPDAALIRHAERLVASYRTEAHTGGRGENHIEARDAAKLHHGLGKHYERAGDFEAAFLQFSRSNAAQRTGLPTFDRERLRDTIAGLIATFSPAALSHAAAHGLATRRPIFIVGMPRSGTTLVEQILASHPEVFGAGELTRIPELAHRLGTLHPGGLAQLAPVTVRALAQDYLDHIDPLAPATARHVTDKLPFNFLHLGLITLLFPHARIVHCRRHPLDVLFSCFVEIFRKIDYMTDLTDIAFYIAQKERLMAHWRQALPTAMYELDYEQLVTQQENQTRRLIDACALPWHDGCLEYFHTERRVNTPSRWQVRQSIYRSSVARWRNYQRHLGPAIELLRDAGLVDPEPRSD